MHTGTRYLLSEYSDRDDILFQNTNIPYLLKIIINKELNIFLSTDIRVHSMLCCEFHGDRVCHFGVI